MMITRCVSLLVMLLILCLTSNMSQSGKQVSASAERNKYIGFRHGLVLPSDLKELGGWDDSFNEVDIAIRQVRSGSVKMLWFDRLTHRDSSGQPFFEVLDVLLLPAISPRQTLVYSICALGSKPDPQILAIAEGQSADKRFYGSVRRAWRVNRSRGRFEEISAKGIKCQRGAE